MIGVNNAVCCATDEIVARSNHVGTGRLALPAASAATQGGAAERGLPCAAMRRVSGPRWRPMRRMDGLRAGTGIELVLTIASMDEPGVVLRPMRPSMGALTRSAASSVIGVKWRT